MIALSPIIPLKRKRLSSLLGLSLDGSRLDGVVLRRPNGSLQAQQTFSVSLSLDPLTADPELVGREIRNHLDAAEVRERYCIVGLPLRWALTTHVELPELAEEDVESFLQIEAERGFPCDASTLHLATSRCRSASGKQQAMLVGIPKSHLTRLEQVFKAAKLKPVSFSLGVTALQPERAEASKGVLALVIGESHVALQVTCGGGVAALRTLEGALESEGGPRVFHPDLVARETRITLGQLPAELRDEVRTIRIFGPRDLAQQLADELELRLEAMALKVEVVTKYAPDEFGLQLAPDTVVSPALSLAAARLAGRSRGFEFLPPKITAWKQLTTKYSSGKLRGAGMAAAAVVVLVLGLFGYQQWQLEKLRSEWKSLGPRVDELNKVQDQIRTYRPWFDESARAMTILKQVTQAFPEDGVVSARTVEIRDLNIVTCTGTAKDNPSLLKTLDRLRSAGGVSELKVVQIRGKNPMQFTFDFHWSEGGHSEN
jgi:hypothetical protein